MVSEFSARHAAKFDRTNFLGWKFQMKSLFIAHGIHDIVTGVRAMPVDRESEDAKTWVKENAKAMFLISSAMEYPQLESLLVYTTAKEMWDVLKLIYEQKSASNKLMLTHRFHAYSMDPLNTVVQHIAKVQNMAMQPLDLGENVSQVTIMAKILASLTSKFNHFRTAWDSVEPDRQTIEYLKERLIQEENRLSHEDEGATALAAVTRKQNGNASSDAQKKKAYGKPGQNSKKNIVCYRC